MPEKCRMGIGILSLRKYILLEIFFQMALYLILNGES